MPHKFAPPSWLLRLEPIRSPEASHLIVDALIAHKNVQYVDISLALYIPYLLPSV